MTSDSKQNKDLTCKVNKWGVDKHGEETWRIESGSVNRYRVLPVDKIPTETRLRLTMLKMIHDGDAIESVGHRILDNLFFVCIPRAEYDELFV